MTSILSHRWTANKKPIVELLKLCDVMVIERYMDAMASRNAAAVTFGKENKTPCLLEYVSSSSAETNENNHSLEEDELAFAVNDNQWKTETQVVLQNHDNSEQVSKRRRRQP